MQKNFTINNFGIKKSIVSEWILKAFRDARNRMQRGVFYYKAQKNKKNPNKTSSHKQWLEQADNTNAQALVWCPVKKQTQPRLVSMPLVPAAPQARKMEAKPV